MLTMFFFLSMLHGCEQIPLPVMRIPVDTLVMRESFGGPGAERTSNWWGRFDTRGCWWEAHNTWLVVHDDFLLRSPAHSLHWNAVEPKAPWFCLSTKQFADLMSVSSGVESGQEDVSYSEPMDRWIVVRSDGVHSRVLPRGHQTGDWEGLIQYFDLLSSAHVWGQSPEES